MADLPSLLSQYGLGDPRWLVPEDLKPSRLLEDHYAANPWALPPPPVPEPRAELRNTRRPDDPFMAGAREYIGADAVAKGSYGLGHILADTYGKGREGDIGGVAHNLPELLAIFAGPRAKTANHAMLAKAQEMASKGIPPTGIWSETGWLQGKDGKWRFEIPDERSYFKETAIVTLTNQT